MANMSYCRFENTFGDLRDCVNALNEEDLPESMSEKQHASWIYKKCQEYIEAYEQVEEQITPYAE